MYLKNKYNIANTYKSFVRYIKIYRKYILVDLYKYETKGAFYTEKEIDDYVDHYHKLNSRKIGLKMKLVRETNDMSKTELALRLNVNRKTISLLESGERLPSLEFIYNFCKIFDYSIDKMLS